jgi:hypothetical protein
VDPENGSRGRWRWRERRENVGEEARNQRSAAITVDRTSALTVVFCIYAEAQTGLEDMNVEGERRKKDELGARTSKTKQTLARRAHK